MCCICTDSKSLADLHTTGWDELVEDSSSSLVVPSLLMLDESGLVSKDPVAVIAKCNSLFFSFFLFPNHAV